VGVQVKGGGSVRGRGQELECREAGAGIGVRVQMRAVEGGRE
jgi:hypothetical protein